MTSPLDDPSSATARGVWREVVGLLCVLVGLIVLGVLLGTVDGRLAAGLGALVLISGGLWLGVGRDDGEV